MRKRAPSERVFVGFSPDFQRDMLHYLTTVVCSENRPKAGIIANGICRLWNFPSGPIMQHV